MAVAAIGCCKRPLHGDSRCHSEVANTSSKSISSHIRCITCPPTCLAEQDAPAARGVLLALAKLCGPTNWPRRHLLALDICLSAGGGDTGACNALINEFLDVNGPLDRSDQDIHLKAKLKLQLQRNSIDIHIAQFAGYASSAAAPVFAALVGATATPNTPQSASFDSNAINQVLQYRSDFLAVPFVIAAQVGKRVEESIDQDILGQCRFACYSVAMPYSVWAPFLYHVLIMFAVVGNLSSNK